MKDLLKFGILPFIMSVAPNARAFYTFPVTQLMYCMRPTHAALLAAGALTFFGAGCSFSSQPSVQAPDSAANRAAVVPPAEPSTPDKVSPVNATTSTTPTSPSMNQEPLSYPGLLSDEKVANKIVRIQTSKGEVVFELLPKEGPRAASNFAYLAGRGFYDGLTFHRVVPGFVVQGGDPRGDGTGGPGYQFQDDPVSLSYARGIVAMANAGPNTNGSQFFIMLQDNPLPPAYSIFGRVISGMDVVDKLAIGDTMTTVTVEDKK